MRSRKLVSTLMSTCFVALATGCSLDTSSGPERPPALLPGANSASASVIPCPPSIPAGYTLVYCFDFDLIPGVFHGFYLQRSTSQSPPGAYDGDFSEALLSHDYLLISPTGFQRLTPGSAFDHLTPAHLFQAEFNGPTTTWYDVVRIFSPVSQPPARVTIAVARRAKTPALQAAAITQQVNQLQGSGALSSGQATSLTQKLDAAIASLDAGNTTSALNVLHAFINHVQALMSGPSPVLGAAQGQALIDAAQAVIDRLTP